MSPATDEGKERLRVKKRAKKTMTKTKTISLIWKKIWLRKTEKWLIYRKKLI